MHARTLNHTQFKLEKNNILSVLLKWQKEVDEFIESKLKEFSYHLSNYFEQCLSNSSMLYHWRESVSCMIKFLQKDLTVEDEGRNEEQSFTFFIVEDNGIAGMAFGSVSTYQT